MDHISGFCEQCIEHVNRLISCIVSIQEFLKGIVKVERPSESATKPIKRMEQCQYIFACT